MIDEFPDMPTRLCPACKVEKKIMFFSSAKVTYCRECLKVVNRDRITPNPAPADAEFQVSSKMRMDGTR
ncbi:MAG TPA: hypothetical protein DIT28_16565 [Oxalobacteraceae bacterium]|nr:hypothetical protein [Oxalobacteraceae bacterium]